MTSSLAVHGVTGKQMEDPGGANVASRVHDCTHSLSEMENQPSGQVRQFVLRGPEHILQDGWQAVQTRFEVNVGLCDSKEAPVQAATDLQAVCPS